VNWKNQIRQRAGKEDLNLKLQKLTPTVKWSVRPQVGAFPVPTGKTSYSTVWE